MFAIKAMVCTLIAAYLSSTVEGGNCPRGWRSFETHCYRLYKTKMNWYDAWMYCRRQGADLVQIDNSDENNFVARTYRCDSWLGGTDLAREGTWKWFSSGRGICYTNWSRHEPNDHNHNEDCVHLYRSGRWNDNHCASKFYFICESNR